MPIINFTTGDFLAGKILEKGGYGAMLTELSQKASASQKSVNFFATFTLTGEGVAGKEIKCIFNTESNNISILGSMQFFPHHYLMKVKAAVEDVKFDSMREDLQLDTDTIMNRPLDLLIDTVPNQEIGDLMNIITAFLPEGASKTAVPF